MFSSYLIFDIVQKLGNVIMQYSVSSLIPKYFGVKLNSLLTAHVTQVENEVGEIVMCIVQNKIDLIDEACITP